MKKLTLLAFAMVFALVVAAMAGDYHSGANLNCAECHVMHYSQTHGYNSNGGGITVDLGNAGPYHYLLRNEINDLCLTCHDGQTFAPDVFEVGTGAPANGRLAGALNRDNVSPYFDATGHTLGSTDDAPGGTWDNPDGLNCTNCHTQHGRGGSWGGVSYSLYRNANIFINGTPTTPLMTYAIGTNDLTRDIFERSATYGGTHYDLLNVDYNEPDPTQSGYGRFCGQCHTNFHGTVGSAEIGGTGTPASEFLRHPTAGANIGALGGGHSSLTRKYDDMLYRLKVMSPTGNWGTWGVAFGGTSTVSNAPTDHTPSCMTCHKAHGTTRAFGLIWATGTTPYGENGDGTRYDQQCGQCHAQVAF